LEPVNRPRLPAIVLGDQALALIRDIFNQPVLFSDAPRVRRRVVAWGVNATPVELDHSAIIVSEATLLNSIRPTISRDGNQDVPWTILAARPLPEPAVEHCFGTRVASSVAVTLKKSSDRSTCWIESLDNGWLFLTPGWLFAVGAPAETLLERSRVVAAQIAAYGGAHGTFPASARIAAPLWASNWLACGTAAMAFDPICGDGTAYAVREAILASAIIRALANGGSPDELRSHYEARLTAGFRRHLALCSQFYQSGGDGQFWQAELRAVERGIE